MESAFKLLHFHIGSQIPDILTIKRAVREAAHVLREAPQDRPPARVPRRRRRPRHRLRRLALDVPLLDELHGRGVRERHRLQHHGRLRRREGAASEHRLGVGPRHRRAPLGARRRGLRRDREDAARAARRSAPPDHKLDPRARSTSTSTSPTRTSTSPGTTCCRSRRRRRRCSSSASSSSTSRRASRRSSGRSPSGSQRIVASMDPEEVPEDLRDARRASSPISTSATSRCSSRCSITGRSAQLFPIVPIHRLDERPQLESTLVDITCDSDGKVAKFIDLNDVRETLPLHEHPQRRAVLPRHLPHGRLPGHHGRHPQPLRPRERGPRLPR